MINRLSSYLNEFCYRRFSRREYLLDRLVAEHRSKWIRDLFTYPSVINNGYLHFERLFMIADEMGLKESKGYILDIGGADGVTAIKLYEHFQNAKVRVFEPIPDNIAVLTKNIHGKDAIELYPVALGSEKKETEMTITARITSSSLLDVNTRDLGNDYMSTQLKPQQKIRIKVDTVDSCMQAGDTVLLMKLDVQGYELEVLRGAVNTLRSTQLIMAEVQNHELYKGAPMYHDIDAFLHDNGFVLMDMIPSLREKMKLMEWDAIYANSNLLKGK